LKILARQHVTIESEAKLHASNVDVQSFKVVHVPREVAQN
jgi:hypothetical protein